jgi:hypothetical protein
MKATAPATPNGDAKATAVATRSHRKPPKPQLPPQPNSLLEAIIFAASDPGIDIAKVEHLIRLRKEMEAAEAEQRFNEALARAQSEMVPIAANATNNQTSSRYATYAQLDRAIRPVYSRHDLALTFTTGERSGDTAIEVVAYLIGHGHSRRYALTMPADGKGARGGDVMTRTHAAASACSYGMRYLAVMIFNLSIDKDDDGNAAGRQSSAALKRSGVWAEFERDMRAAKTLFDLEAVCNRWRSRMANWSHGYKTAAIEVKGQCVERLGGTLMQLQESVTHLDQEEAERIRAAISEDQREPNFSQLYQSKPWR